MSTGKANPPKPIEQPTKKPTDNPATDPLPTPTPDPTPTPPPNPILLTQGDPSPIPTPVPTVKPPSMLPTPIACPEPQPAPMDLETFANLQQIIEQYRQALSQLGLTYDFLNEAAVLEHNKVQKQEIDAYMRLKKLIEEQGPTLSITKTTTTHGTPFQRPLKVKQLSNIPSLFSIEIVGTPHSPPVPPPGPKYLSASIKAFCFGVQETRFVMKSKNLPIEINFDPTSPSTLFQDVIDPKDLFSRVEQSRIDYILKIYELMFKMYLANHFLLSNVSFNTQVGSLVQSGDYVSLYEMIKNQYVDQDEPLLPAAGYGNQAAYVTRTVEEMFRPQHHMMQIGETARTLLSQRKVFRHAGVITDQYTAAFNTIFIDDLRRRSINANNFMAQHQALTMDTVSLRVQDPSVFTNTLIPFWTREESDGSLLLYALDVKRQKNYINHLIDLLMSVNLVSFATIEQVAEAPPRRSLQDPTMQQVLDNILSSGLQADFFRGLALDMSTTWVDIELDITCYHASPVDQIFKLFNILLWFIYFPSIARDNVPKLLYEMFTVLEITLPNLRGYLNLPGFSTYPGRRSVIQEYDKVEYFNNIFTYPIITRNPGNNFRILRDIHLFLNDNDAFQVVNTSDAQTISTPRMSDVRQYGQPYQSVPAVSNNPADGENNNVCANRLMDAIQIVIKVIEAYKARYQASTSRSQFGNTRTLCVEMLSYFNAYTPSLLASAGIRAHAEIFALRKLAANSPYIIDCQNLTRDELMLRPQVLFQTDTNLWMPIAMQRASERLPFELPLFTFLTLQGAPSIDAISPPNPVVQFENLQAIQEEGILCGDLISYVNGLKFGNIGPFNREALGISNVITAARADKIFTTLSKIAEMSQFSDLFEILIHDVSHRIDSRAVNFKISLQPYKSQAYHPDIVQPLDSLYGQNLRLGRPFLNNFMNIAAPIFVPETSPISLYTTGLIITYRFVSDLDPFEIIDPITFIESMDRIIMWSPTIIGRRIKDASRFMDEIFLRIPNANGEFDEYILGAMIPKMLIIVTMATGSISKYDFDVLKLFFHEKNVSFLFPELMIMMKRMPMQLSVTEEIGLIPQFEDILVGIPNRRVTLLFGDTISQYQMPGLTFQKKKFLYPINPVHQRDLIMRGVVDPVMQNNFKIGSWMSWAFGGPNGRTIEVRRGENIIQPDGQPAMVDDEIRQIDKLTLGLVNFNNEMQILTMSDYLRHPTVLQDTTRAYADIYLNRNV